MAKPFEFCVAAAARLFSFRAMLTMRFRSATNKVAWESVVAVLAALARSLVPDPVFFLDLS